MVCGALSIDRLSRMNHVRDLVLQIDVLTLQSQNFTWRSPSTPARITAKANSSSVSWSTGKSFHRWRTKVEVMSIREKPPKYSRRWLAGISRFFCSVVSWMGSPSGFLRFSTQSWEKSVEVHVPAQRDVETVLRDPHV